MGTIINAIAIVLATLLGLLLKRGLSEKMQQAIMFVLGLGLAVLSIGWFLKDFFVIQQDAISTRFDLLIIISLVIGTVIGEWIDIEGRLNNWAEGIEKKYNLPPLAKGFIAATLIFCVGAMAILGAIQDGLGEGITILLMKSTLDFVTGMLLASVLGIGVMFSALSVLVYQGAITILAANAAQLLTMEMITSLSMVGNIILVAIGINFMDIKKVKVANMLPSLLIPIIYFAVMTLF